MDKVYPCLYYGIAGMCVSLLAIEWVILKSKFVEKYHKTNSKIHFVMLPIIAVLIIMLMCVATKRILIFIIMSCVIGYDNHLTKEMLYSKNKDSINDRKE